MVCTYLKGERSTVLSISPQELKQWTTGTLVYGEITECKGVFTDSRSPVTDGLFIALQGERFDGHAFVGAVAAAGAAGAIVSDNQVAAVVSQLETNHNPFFLVSVANTLDALHDLARGNRKRFTGPVIAVTGSNGKTSTKAMITACIGTQTAVHATKLNYNNEVGLPLTLLGLIEQHGACVVEVAMRGLGQLTYLAATALPDIAVVTNVGPVHLETLGTIENVAKAKAELVQALSPQGIAVLNADDPRVAAMEHLAPGEVITYGLSDIAKVQARDVTAESDGNRFDLYIDNHRVNQVVVSLPGRHNVSNALAAIAATYAAGFSIPQAVTALATLSAPPMRMQFIPLENDICLINDAYNASPLSMRAALEVLATTSAKRKVAVLGDMLELGSAHEEQHRQVGRLAHDCGVEFLVSIGSGGSLIAAGAQEAGMRVQSSIQYNTAVEAAVHVRNWLRPGDLVLVKASRSMRLEHVADAVVAMSCIIER
jgi:UDP-N-acetylmuramoyl-tripeptide--D-alanyl-D-alanine ligase